MRTLLMAAVAITTVAAFAEKPAKTMTKEERIAQYEATLRREGGLVKVSGKGNVVAYDLRATSDLAAVRKAWAELVNQLRISFVAKEGKGKFSLENAEALKREAGGAAVVFIVDDPVLPMTLTAQEAQWSLLNVAPLKAGNPSAEAFSKRFTLGFLRAATRAIGSDISRFDSSFLAPATKAEDFDAFKGHDLTFDTQMGVLSYIPKIGIEPLEFESYQSALEDGYDIAPTNDVQKAIWKKYKESQKKD